ncbi:MAG TPA: Ig domain-containing protein [Gaiellaceae bacterium]|nr:Ig domain-containing protein [Gaiellaceae bacterium]
MRLAHVAAAVVVFTAMFAAGASAFGIDLENPPTPGVVGMPYKYVFIPKKGAPPYAFWFDSGDLPPGLKIEPDGTMQGTPQAPGKFEFTVAASQYDGSETQWGTSVTIRDRLNITTASLRSATAGQPYSTSITVVGSGGLGMGWQIASGALPPGVTLAQDPAGGSPGGQTTISGTPTATGTYTFTLKVGDTDGFLPDRSVTRQYTLAVVAPLAVAASGTVPKGIVGKAFRAAPAAATGGLAPHTWTIAAGSAPGLALDPATGALVGRPTAAGSFPLTLRASDADGRTATVDVVVRVVAALDLVTTKLRNATVGDPYKATLRARGGEAPRRFAITGGRLPAGLKLNAKTGVISGVPKDDGTSRFRVTVRDALGQRSSERLAISVHV